MTDGFLQYSILKLANRPAEHVVTEKHDSHARRIYRDFHNCGNRNRYRKIVIINVIFLLMGIKLTVYC